MRHPLLSSSLLFSCAVCVVLCFFAAGVSGVSCRCRYCLRCLRKQWTGGHRQTHKRAKTATAAVSAERSSKSGATMQGQCTDVTNASRSRSLSLSLSAARSSSSACEGVDSWTGAKEQRKESKRHSCRRSLTHPHSLALAFTQHSNGSHTGSSRSTLTV